MPERAAEIEAFLAAHGWRARELRPLAGDASFRSYRRLVRGAKRAVLMDAPPAHEDVRPFVRMAEHLRRLGLSAPEVYAADVGAGLLLLEDLGDDTFTRLLAAGEEERGLYRLAIDVLIALHALAPERAIPPGLFAYDGERLINEALLFFDWYLPAVTADPPAAAARQSYALAWHAVLPAILAQPPTLVLRDYHVDNLMRLPDREGLAACGLLDFQDAVAGAAAYDLMSLLEDARRDVDDGLRREMLSLYLERARPADPAAFATAYAVLAAQRHAKVIGIFTRLSRRDGKNGYLAHIPRVWGLLERALANRALAPVAAWFDRNVPAAVRGTAPPLNLAAQ